MTHPPAILTVSQMGEADRLAVAGGVPSLTLMENAGRAIADEICRRTTQRPVAVLCGPGNNGGDGYVAARRLKERGWPVTVFATLEAKALKGDAGEMAKRWDGPTKSVGDFKAAAAHALIVDALFGAGLARPLEGPHAALAWAVNEADAPVIAVDVPSGLHGDTARMIGEGEAARGLIRADLTVTFFCKKPAHVLMPGRALCGEVVVADIGIPASVLETIAPKTFENRAPRDVMAGIAPRLDAHKYMRGHALVVSGHVSYTGAARLAARAALRVGAGLVTVASPKDALAVNAGALTAGMVRECDGEAGLTALLADRRKNAVVLGPGLGVGEETKSLVRAALMSGAAVVLDADALTSFAADPNALLSLLRDGVVLTPHAGEFERVFPGVQKEAPNKIEAARAAAARAKAVVLLKGADTVIAAPDGRAAVNTNAPPALATAGSGDVLAGLIGGLMAQGLGAFDAACAAVWLHGEAANAFGPGLIAEDLSEQIPGVLNGLQGAEHGPGRA